MQNNRAYHREWLAKVQQRQRGRVRQRNDTAATRGDDVIGKQGVAAGFEYAVQPDGSCLAERHWRKGRRMQPISNGDGVNGSGT